MSDRTPDAGSSWAVTIPTIGRPSLGVLLDSLRRSAEVTGLPLPPIFVVDDRPDPQPPLDLPSPPAGISVLRSHGTGPAAARNVGWRAAETEWVAFLDDDVVVSEQWLADVRRDLRQPPDVGGVSGRIVVPLPSDRRPTDWERGTAGLATAKWITADMAYRTEALRRVAGFDERFPRAFREDADLALRVLDAGYQLVHGERRTQHPVRPAGWWASLHQQRGNADDVRMDRVHGRGWRRRAEAPLGRRPLHLLTTALAVTVPLAWVLRRRRAAAVAAAGWAILTADFSWRRIRPGPRDRVEVLKMLTTSVAIPPAATWHWTRALLRSTSGLSLSKELRHSQGASRLPAAVLVDRDGTIVTDVPYNGDPDRVEPMPGAAAALQRLRRAGIPIGVISNQSGIGRGLIDHRAVEAVNARIEALLGPFDAWVICPHTDADGCDCRKPKPGLVHQAAQRLGVSPAGCVVIGDIGADMGSAQAAGAGAILVPTEQTRPEEVRAAPRCAPTLAEAVDVVLAGRY
jgi:HAD superfamily hydrolase (TIGR01662 family)